MGLLRANARSRLLLAFEERPLPGTSLDYAAAFFDAMHRRGCTLERVPLADLDGERTRAEISLWRGCVVEVETASEQ